MHPITDMKVIKIILLAIFLLSPFAALAEPVKIAAWNIEHLRDTNGEGPNDRSDTDYERLAHYVRRINADIKALQEVEVPPVASRIFNPLRYQFFFSRRNAELLTGFAIRKGIETKQNPDLTGLNVDGDNRHGTDISVKINGHWVRMLSVHLKSGCWGDPLNASKDACRKLSAQLPVLESWIDARVADGVPFLVLGDFNRRFDNNADDTFWPEIDDGTPANADLFRVTENHTDQCWGSLYPNFIDHIVLDLISTKWVVKGSFSHLVYDEGTEYKKKLSDHCPVIVIINPDLALLNERDRSILNSLDLIDDQMMGLRQIIIEQKPEGITP